MAFEKDQSSKSSLMAALLSALIWLVFLPVWLVVGILYEAHSILSSRKLGVSTRSLKIELAGDIFRRKTYPKIRLQGQWLARLGFNPAARVSVIPVTTGELVIKVERSNQ